MSEQWLCGFHAVEASLKSNADGARQLLAQRGRRDARLQKTMRLARTAGVEVRLAGRREMEATAGMDAPVALLTRAAQPRDLDWLCAHLQGLECALVLVLDAVGDPHNLGACLRSAAAAGADALVVPRANACGLTAAARRVASGGAEVVPVVWVTNICRSLERIKDCGVWVVGTAADAGPCLHDIDMRGPCALVLGGEQAGIRPLVRKHCDHLARIDMATDAVASLNLSVSAGIALFEARRQRTLATGGS